MGNGQSLQIVTINWAYLCFSHT